MMVLLIDGTNTYIPKNKNLRKLLGNVKMYVSMLLIYFKFKHIKDSSEYKVKMLYIRH